MCATLWEKVKTGLFVHMGAAVKQFLNSWDIQLKTTQASPHEAKNHPVPIALDLKPSSPTPIKLKTTQPHTHET